MWEVLRPWCCGGAAALFTVGVWMGALRIRKARSMPLTEPVFLAVFAIIAALLLLNVDYARDYRPGGNLIKFLLQPAVVALAVRLYEKREMIRRNARAVAVGVIVGSVTGIVSATGLALLCGAPDAVALSLAPKSVTAPIAMGISGSIGGIESLTVGIVIATGIIGAMVGPELVRLIGIRNRVALGLAVGMASHGIGTARLMKDDEASGNHTASTMSGVGMTLNGLVTAILCPVIVQWLL